MANGTGTPARINMAATMALNWSTAPTEISMPPVIMMMVMPSAIMASGTKLISITSTLGPLR